jgi:hypothetical protein
MSEPVGWFNPWNDYHGYQQVAKEHEGEEGTIPLYAFPCDWQPIWVAPSREYVLICNPQAGRYPLIAKRIGQQWFSNDQYGTRVDPAPTYFMRLPPLPSPPKEKGE